MVASVERDGSVCGYVSCRPTGPFQQSDLHIRTSHGLAVCKNNTTTRHRQAPASEIGEREGGISPGTSLDESRVSASRQLARPSPLQIVYLHLFTPPSAVSGATNFHLSHDLSASTA